MLLNEGLFNPERYNHINKELKPQKFILPQDSNDQNYEKFGLNQPLLKINNNFGVDQSTGHNQNLLLDLVKNQQQQPMIYQNRQDIHQIEELKLNQQQRDAKFNEQHLEANKQIDYRTMLKLQEHQKLLEGFDSKRQKKTREQLEILENEYQNNPVWTYEKKCELALGLNLSFQQISKWQWDRKQNEDKIARKQSKRQQKILQKESKKQLKLQKQKDLIKQRE
eukprot:403369125